VFVDTGMEYSEVRDFVNSVPNVITLHPEMPFNKVIKKYGYPVISKEVARCIYYARKGSEWALCNLKGLFKTGEYSTRNQRFKKWAHLVDAPFLISDYCCEVMKKRPFKKFVKETGCKPIIGTMACESFRRQTAWLMSGCNGFNKKDPSSQPMSFWTEQDVLAYLKLTGIPYASIYGDIVEDGEKLKTTGAERTGCMFCMFGVQREKQPNRFQRMAISHPKQYDYCINRLGCGAVLDHIGVPYGKEVENNGK